MLELNNVSTTLGGRLIINRVSLTLQKGQRLSIIGTNGSGKTTLLKTMAGLLPFTGDISYDTTSIRGKRPKELAKLFAMLSQGQGLQFDHTVMELMMMGRYVHQQGLLHSSAQDKKIVQDILDTLNLTHLANTRINTLSGGQAQRVHLATALAQDTPVILLDELTNHLDIKHQVELIRFLKHWAADRIVVGVFHDVNMALEMSDNLLLLDAGQVVSQGGAQEVLPHMNEVYGFDIGGFMREALGRW